MVRTMTPVTDPNLIAQLEGNSQGGSGYGAPVTDPGLIAQLEGTGQQAQQGNPSFLPRVGADALAGLAQMGHGLLNTPHNVVSYFNPQLGAKIPAQQDYNFSSMLGVNNPNLGDKLIQGAAQYAPYMMGGEAALATMGGKAAPLLTRALAQSGAGATFGATQSQNPMTGAAIGAGFGAGAELAPAAIGATKNFIGNRLNAIQPQKFAEQLMQTLGGGNSLEGNAQSLAQDIKNAYSNRVMQGQALYKPVFDAAGNNSIYEGMNPATSAYQSLENGLLGSNRNLNNLHQQFSANPTLQNAHDLQSQLGTAIRKLQSSDAKGNLSVADRNTMQGYQAAQDAVRGDINSFLSSKNPALANQYNSATANWAQNVTPYLESSKLSQIAKGDVTNPTAIANLFKNPEPEMQQIVNDIGPQANNKILYSELGKTQANLTPEKLTNSVNQLDNKGLSSYVTPELAQQFEQLGSKTSARNAAQTIFGVGLGAHLGGPLGAVLGTLTRPAISKLGQLTPSLNLPLGNALMNAGRAAYRPTINSGTANLINYQGGR